MTKPPSTSFSDGDFFESLRSPRKLNMIILCQQKSLDECLRYVSCEYPVED